MEYLLSIQSGLSQTLSTCYGYCSCTLRPRGGHETTGIYQPYWLRFGNVAACCGRACGALPRRQTMPTYKAPVDDALFLLNDVFHLDHYGNLPGFSEASPDVVEAVLREAAKFSEEVLTPLNRVGDKEGCKRGADGSVTTPKGFKEAYAQIVEGGWIGISAPPEFGGQGLPATLTELVN